jgi:hypothetical protein
MENRQRRDEGTGQTVLTPQLDDVLTNAISDEPFERAQRLSEASADRLNCAPFFQIKAITSISLFLTIIVAPYRAEISDK